MGGHPLYQPKAFYSKSKHGHVLSPCDTHPPPPVPPCLLPQNLSPKVIAGFKYQKLKVSRHINLDMVLKWLHVMKYYTVSTSKKVRSLHSKDDHENEPSKVVIFILPGSDTYLVDVCFMDEMAGFCFSMIIVLGEDNSDISNLPR